jgi:hypothetical protein
MDSTPAVEGNDAVSSTLVGIGTIFARPGVEVMPAMVRHTPNLVARHASLEVVRIENQ